jgi:hypothetical protein
VLGIAEATTVAAGKDFAALLQTGSHELSGSCDAGDVSRVGQKPVEHGTGFG